MRNTFTRLIVMIFSAGLIAQLSACGTILHPERKGQRSGQIDPKIVVLDAIGLLFFFIPGVIAFAVDFYTGTIYLPGGRRASLSPQEMEYITHNGKVDQEKLTDLLKDKGLISAHINTDALDAKPVASLEEAQLHLAAANVQYASK